MKTILALFALTFALLVTGCGTVGGLFTAQPVPTVTDQVTSTTNMVPEIQSIEAVAVEDTPAGPILTTNVVNVTNMVPSVVWATNKVLVWQTNYAVAPGVQATLDGAKAVTDSVPIPWAGVASGVLALVSGGLGWMAKVKSRKAQEAASELVNVGDQLAAVIKGVETANRPEVKAAITAKANNLGVQPDLHRTVQVLTRG